MENQREKENKEPLILDKILVIEGEDYLTAGYANKLYGITNMKLMSLRKKGLIKFIEARKSFFLHRKKDVEEYKSLDARIGKDKRSNKKPQVDINEYVDIQPKVVEQPKSDWEIVDDLKSTGFNNQGRINY